MRRRLAVLTSVAAIASVAVGAAPAAADQKPTPNNKCGAANMTNEHAFEAMMTAMNEHTAEQGDAGMRAAVARTRC